MYGAPPADSPELPEMYMVRTCAPIRTTSLGVAIATQHTYRLGPKHVRIPTKRTKVQRALWDLIHEPLPDAAPHEK